MFVSHIAISKQKHVAFELGGLDTSKSSFSEGLILSFKMRGGGVWVILCKVWAQNNLSNKSKQTFVVGCYAIFSYVLSDVPVLQEKLHKSHKIEIPE